MGHGADFDTSTKNRSYELIFRLFNNAKSTISMIYDLMKFLLSQVSFSAAGSYLFLKFQKQYFFYVNIVKLFYRVIYEIIIFSCRQNIALINRRLLVLRTEHEMQF